MPHGIIYETEDASRSIILDNMKKEDLHKFIWPITIIIAALILGGSYYATEANKQASIERQQQATLQQQQAKQEAATEQQNMIAAERASCVTQAQDTAISEYKTAFCGGTNYSANCYNGTYLVAQYNNAYTTCLESKGLQ